MPRVQLNNKKLVLIIDALEAALVNVPPDSLLATEQDTARALARELSLIVGRASLFEVAPIT